MTGMERERIAGIFCIVHFLHRRIMHPRAAAM